MLVDVVLLSRIQFAVTVAFHFLFVPLTIGLALLVAIMETKYVRSGDANYQKMARFWGKLFIINFVLGVVTGITMEFQFGTNWSEYSKFMGDIFGSPLAVEAMMAFFLESTFLGIWAFGWNKLSKKAHAFAIWMVAIGTHLSAIWIIVANGWMQNPVGYVLRNGRAEMVDFLAVLSNSYAWYTYFHTILSCYVLAGFFVLGVSAYHLLRRQHLEFFRPSLRMALVLALVGTIGVALTGDLNAKNVAHVQPAKFAALESIWETQSRAPFYLISIPDAANQQNSVQALGIPGLTSWLATYDANAEITGLKDVAPQDRPPVAPVFYSFRFMVLLGIYFLAVILWGWYLDRKGRLLDARRYLKLLLYSIPLPYAAITLGWMVAEIGRQPWAVYGLMRTAHAVSPVPALHVLLSLIAVTVIYTALIVADYYLLAKYAKQGPEAVPLGTQKPEAGVGLPSGTGVSLGSGLSSEG